jgi:hypothetical protein
MSDSDTKIERPIDPLALKRYITCMNCKFFDTNKEICKVCGCGLKTIVNEENAQCPIGKW